MGQALYSGAFVGTPLPGLSTMKLHGRGRGGQLGGLGLLLPPPGSVASPVRAASLVKELAESVAYTHGLDALLVEKGWWSRRICRGLGLARCLEAKSAEEIVSMGEELLEATVDGVRPAAEAPPGRTLLRYYVDSRRGGIVFLGARPATAEA